MCIININISIGQENLNKSNNLLYCANKYKGKIFIMGQRLGNTVKWNIESDIQSQITHARRHSRD